MASIAENVGCIRNSLPEGVGLVAAAKGRSIDQVSQAVRAGVRIIGHNYIQEAQAMKEGLSLPVEWHLIGHLQKNKTAKAVEIFDMIESVDSFDLARMISAAAASRGKIMPVLVEINAAEELSKSGVRLPEAEGLIKAIACLQGVRVEGLMTMGPALGSDQIRPYFRRVKELYKNFSLMPIPGVNMKILSMGMSDSYKTAIEEGANLVRIGRAIFA